MPSLNTALIAALSGAFGAILSALITVVLGRIFLSARDKQDREAEWRKHAIELTKLELERKLKSGRDLKENPLRPTILDFLANYRDLQELGMKSPSDLYKKILSDRISNHKPAEK